MKTYMHVNYFETGYALEEAFRLAKAIGYDGIEVRDRDRSGAMPLDDYLRHTEQLHRRFGLELTFGCRVDTTHADTEVREASLNHLLRVIEFAGRLGVTTLNAFAGPLVGDRPLRFSENGSALAQEHHHEEAARIFRRAAQVAADVGVTLCLETHNGYAHDLAAPAAALVDRIGEPNVKVNLDYGNIILNRRGEPLDHAITTLGDRIGYVHLKNVKNVPGGEEGAFFVTDLKSGDINHYFLVKQLLAAGYRGIFCIENTMKGDRYPAAVDDLAYFRDVLDRVASQNRSAAQRPAPAASGG